MATKVFYSRVGRQGGHLATLVILIVGLGKEGDVLDESCVDIMATREERDIEDLLARHACLRCCVSS